MLRRTPLRRTRKPKGPTARARAARARWLRDREHQHKVKAKFRDGLRCRFPLCRCWHPLCGRKGALTSSHDDHKGMGGDPTGERSLPECLITLCKWRHQDAPISRHAGTLRTRYLTLAKNDGPVAWEIAAAALGLSWSGPSAGGWVEVAREVSVNHLEPLRPWQREVLERLAEMDC